MTENINPHDKVLLQLAIFSHCVHLNPPTIEALTSQLPVLTVDPHVHTGAFLTGFYCNFDHPEQYQTILLPVKSG